VTAPGRVAPAAADGDRYFDPAEFAARDASEERHYWHLHRRRVIARALGRLAPRPGARLLDLGCGVGTVATHLNAAGYVVDYADVHPEALDRARRRARERLGAAAEERRYLRLDVTREAPPPYHGILCLDVLEHLPDDLGVLRRIASSLTAAGPAAFLLLTVPAFPVLWSRWDVAERHQRRYTRRALRQLAEAAGLRVERLSCFFLPLFAPALVAAGLRSPRGRAAEGAPGDATRLVEFRHGVWLSRVMLPLLSPECWWLDRGDLPVGTSLLLVARPR
jgi:SAM-dependent methyltransferase